MLWIEDRGRRRDWLLEPSEEPRAKDAVTALVESLPARLEALGEDEQFSIVERLRAAGWVLEDVQTHERHLAFRARSPAGEEPTAIALFRARTPEPFLSKGDLALAYGNLPELVTGAGLARELFEVLEDRP